MRCPVRSLEGGVYELTLYMVEEMCLVDCLWPSSEYRVLYSSSGRRAVGGGVSGATKSNFTNHQSHGELESGVQEPSS